MVDVLRGVVGQYGNLIARASSFTVTSEDTQFPKARIYDRLASSPYRSNATTTPQSLTVDLNHPDNTNPSFDSWSGGSPVGWTKGEVGTGAVTQENTIVHSGASSVKMTKAAAGDAAFIFKDFAVPSGSFWTFRIWSRDAGLTSVIRFQNLHTGNYYTGLAPAVWGPFTNDYFLISGGSFVEQVFGFNLAGTQPMAVEPFATTLIDLTIIRVLIGIPAGSPAVTMYVDDFYMYPSVDFSSVHHHNLRAGDVVEIQSSPDNSVWTTRATMAMTPRSSYAAFTQQHVRYWRQRMTAFTPTGSSPAFAAPPWQGEWVLSSATTLLKTAARIRANWIQPQARAGLGDAYRYPRTAGPHRDLELEFFHNEEVASYEQMRDEVFVRSRGGGHPMVLAWGPNSDDCVMGAIAPDVEFPREALPHYRHVLRLVEQPPPLFL